MTPEDRTDALMDELYAYVLHNHPTVGASRVRTHPDTFINELADIILQCNDAYELEATWRAEEMQRYAMEAAHD